MMVATRRSTDGDGDLDPFEDFFRQEYPRLLRVLRALCGDYQRAEDVAQEAFSKAYVDWGRISSYDVPAAWVRRVALNRASNVRRRRLREAAAVQRLDPTERAKVIDIFDAHLWRAVARLPEKQRWAIVLFYVGDLSVSDVADVLDCSDGSVKTHLSRGRHALAERLATMEEPT